MAVTPLSFTRTDNNEIRIVWSDGHIARFTMQVFRDRCPCAGCQGESDLFGVKHMPLQLPVMTPGKYDLKSLSPVGNYAVAAAWGDGHDSGIYSWDHLRAMEESPAAGG